MEPVLILQFADTTEAPPEKPCSELTAAAIVLPLVLAPGYAAQFWIAYFTVRAVYEATMLWRTPARNTQKNKKEEP